MSDLHLALRVLEDRDRDGRALPPGTAYAFVRVAPAAYADDPVRTAAQDRIVSQVADAARDAGATDADEVHLAHVTPDELAAAWREHAPMDPPPLNVHVLLAYWTPPTPGRTNP